MQREIVIAPGRLLEFSSRFLEAMGEPPALAAEIAGHLVDADLCGVTSHGTFRLSQYLEQARAGRLVPHAEPILKNAPGGGPLVDGGNNLGIPAMRLATDTALEAARSVGVAAVGIANVSHTGRIGAFVERAADGGCLAILLGGGSRADWRQVVPYGGARAVLPTNPYALAAPGGERGPVAVDFATSAGAGGKVYAALAKGEQLPPGLIVDAAGRPTTDPKDYFAGGGLLPMAGPKGYGLALLAELVGEAIAADARDGLNWCLIAVDLSRFRPPGEARAASEGCLEELRNCPPAPGFARVEIPGERESDLRARRRQEGIPVDREILRALTASAASLGLAEPELV
ncbi:MAG: hypothetical protein GC150_08080 [Rhizobiales bacterium]|nr:hypothetical protein [Hyphomicrobiales bacterium]